MPRKRLPEDERRELITFRLPKKLITELKEQQGYNSIVEKLIVEYLRKKKNSG